MKNTTAIIILDLIKRYPVLAFSEKAIVAAIEALIESYKNGGKLLVCGNGGSAADALHIVGELMKSFVLPRHLTEDEKRLIVNNSDNAEYMIKNLQRALPAISLVNEVSFQTAYANDIAPDLYFAQQVLGYGIAGDILVGISTSGNSKNVIYAIEVARAKGLVTIALTGATGGKLKDKTDILINVPEKETYKIQELHLPVYHCICRALENEFFGECQGAN